MVMHAPLPPTPAQTNLFTMDNILRGTVPRSRPMAPVRPAMPSVDLRQQQCQQSQQRHLYQKYQQLQHRLSLEHTINQNAINQSFITKQSIHYNRPYPEDLSHLPIVHKEKEDQEEQPKKDSENSEGSKIKICSPSPCTDEESLTLTVTPPYQSPSPANTFSPPVLVRSRESSPLLQVNSSNHNDKLFSLSSHGNSSPSNSSEDPMEDIFVDQSSDDEDANKSDTDSSGSSSCAKKKRRVLFTKYQTKELQKRFGSNWYISSQERDALARHLNMDPDQVKIWFQNHRYKVKKLYKEVRERGGVAPSFHPARTYPVLQRDMRKPLIRDPYYSDYAKEQLYLENTLPLNAEYFPNNIYNGSLQGLKGVGFSATPYELADLIPRSPYPAPRTMYPGQFNAFDHTGGNPLTNYMLSAAHLHPYPRVMPHLVNSMHLGVTI